MARESSPSSPPVRAANCCGDAAIAVVRQNLASPPTQWGGGHSRSTGHGLDWGCEPCYRPNSWIAPQIRCYWGRCAHDLKAQLCISVSASRPREIRKGGPVSVEALKRAILRAVLPQMTLSKAPAIVLAFRFQGTAGLGRSKRAIRGTTPSQRVRLSALAGSLPVGANDREKTSEYYVPPSGFDPTTIVVKKSTSRRGRASRRF